MKHIFWKYALIGSCLIISISLFFYDFSKIEILEEDNISIVNYDDGGTIGNSSSELIKNDHSLCFNYTLGKKSPYPFAGIRIDPKNKINFEQKNITVNIPSKKSKRLHIFFALQLNDTLRCTFRHPIVINPQQDIYVLQSENFDIPTWWYKQKNISEDQLPEIDFSQGVSIMIENNVLQEKETQDQICIQSIQISGNNQQVYIMGGLSLIIFNLVIFFIPLLPKKKKVVIEYKAQEINEVDPIDVEKEELSQIISYINQHYDNPELNLKLMKKELKIHENKISTLIKDNFGISYKDYLHQIRITEAKRLLQDSTLNINEVATLVGYGNISTFNRAFKAKEGITPTDFSQNTNN